MNRARLLLAFLLLVMLSACTTDEPSQITAEQAWQLRHHGFAVDETVVADLVAQSSELPRMDVAIQDCANETSITFEGTEWFPFDLPAEWQDEANVSVAILSVGEGLIAFDAFDHVVPFIIDGTGRTTQPCASFEFEPVT